MDQEKFDQHLMDYLFDELDEVTRAAMKRKLESDAQCREIEAGLRATLEVGQLPLEEPSDDLEDRILSAAMLARQREPWHIKVIRSLSWAGSHAMRPQFAMAARLMLVLGSSILLLRSRPGSVAVTPGKDTLAGASAAPEAPVAGEPTAAATAFAVAQRQAAAAKAAGQAAPSTVARADEPNGETAESTDDPEAVAVAEADADADAQLGRAMKNFKAGNFSEAQRDFVALNRAGGSNAAVAGLYEARAVRAQSSCKGAIAIYERVRQNHAASTAASTATFEQADCYRLLGQNAQASKLWLALKSDKVYGSRAAHELSNQGEAGTSGKGATAAKRKAAAKPPGGSHGNAKAAPKPAPVDAAAF